MAHSKQKIMARGAEAIISRQGSKVIKNRTPKGYRHIDLDKKLRVRRTRSEKKLLEKASSIIPVPKILNTNHKKSERSEQFQINMNYINGKRLSDHLDNLKLIEITNTCKQIGKNIAKLHDAGLIHGDLTTSNMILVQAPNKISSLKRQVYNFKTTSKKLKQLVYFIDFGLGFHSDRIEDKAVDLHLISQALEAKHHTIYQKAFKAVLDGYKISKNYSKTIKQLEKVEKRGRYKQHD